MGKAFRAKLVLAAWFLRVPPALTASHAALLSTRTAAGSRLRIESLVKMVEPQREVSWMRVDTLTIKLDTPLRFAACPPHGVTTVQLKQICEVPGAAVCDLS